MKAFLKIKYLLFFLTTALYFSSCEKPASEETYGFAKIYMPQAIFTDNGKAIYRVPGALDPRYPNYTFDSLNGKLNVILGIYRSGMQSLEEFTVELYVNTDSTNNLLRDSVIANGELLPADVYTFPSTVTVKSGTRESIFYLSIDVAKLNSNYASLAGKPLLTSIGIKNPSKYELNESLATTKVVIDTIFMKKPVIIESGVGN
jgi:hypothetical protein